MKQPRSIQKNKRTPKEAAVSFMLEAELKNQFETIAIDGDRPVSAVYREALRAYLKSRQPAAAA